MPDAEAGMGGPERRSKRRRNWEGGAAEGRHREQFDLACVMYLLVAARKRTTTGEILLWMIPSEPPKALQTSECSELLDPMRASC